MPIYVYRDLATGETFERTQRPSEAPLEASPYTGNPVKRVPQVPLVTFVGPGFASNDLRPREQKPKNRREG